MTIPGSSPGTGGGGARTRCTWPRRSSGPLRPGACPGKLYVDNGACFVDETTAVTCAKLGIRITHSPPYRPEGRGKIERFFETVRGQFLVEISPDGKPAPGRRVPDGLEQLNGWFTTWVEHEYHVRVHSSTGATPLARWSTGTPRFTPAAQLDAAFLWEAIRTVAARTATIKFQGNIYETAPELAGQAVTIRYSPFDLTGIEVFHRGRQPRHRAAARHQAALPPQGEAGPAGRPGRHRDRLPAAAGRQARRRRRHRAQHQLRRPRPARRRPWRPAMINDAVRGYFGFERLPFDRSIPVGALFASASHNEAVGRIAYGIDTRQITVITGEVGAGKTVAARAAVARLDASRYQLITIPNPQVGARGIHHAVVTALGGVPRVHHATLIPQAAGHLAAELAERGRLPVLLIDEAHLLSHDQLEAIRMLTSAQLDSASPLAVLLLGQPQLRASMRLGVLAALDQRIGVRYAMAPMTRQETTGYLRHHTKLAGRSDTLFSDDAAELIHQASRGYPRAVNRLAAAALLATYTTHKTIADTTAVHAAITEVNDQ